MPVSHLGLAVSHIPSATSFYLSALQPLGYRYIGHQGDSIGLGIESADLFLTQISKGSSTSPTHIAFSADTRLIVRECYTAALNAGGRPNGPPGYRNDDCTCFNAAVEDFDGNTVEFIYRQPHLPSNHDTAATPEHGRSQYQQDDDLEDDEGRTVNSRVSRNTKASKSSSKPEPSTEAQSATRKESVSNTLIGTVLGAAAGAAIVYAMCKTEQQNSKEEAEYLSAKQSQKASRSIEENRPPSPTAETVPATKSEKNGRKSHRNFSTTESTYVSRRPSEFSGMRAIEAAPHEEDPILESISRYTAQRAESSRRQTYDAIEYIPAPSSGQANQFSMKRAVTLPTGVDYPDYYIEAPRSATSSRHSASSRHSHRSRGDNIDSDSKLRRHDSGVSMRSSRSHREHGTDSERRSSRSSTSTIKPVRQESTFQEENSTTSRSVPYDYVSTRSKSAASSRRKQASYFDSAIEVPLPPSIASSAYPESSKMLSAYQESVPASTRSSAYKKSLPPSVASSAYEKPLPPSVVSSAYQKPLPSSVVSSAYQKPLPQSVVSSAHQKPLPSSVASSKHQRSQPQSIVSSPSQKPLPPSVASSANREHSIYRRDSSQYESAVEIPMPSSKATSYVSAAQVPLPSSQTGAGDISWEDILGEESDGLDTVVPDDSISCVDFSKPRHRRSSHSGRKSHRSGHSSRRSEASSDRTVKPLKKSNGSRYSALTLPMRSRKEDREREDGKRSAVSYS